VIEKIRKYIREVMVEMKKVAWPTFPELKNSTGVVVVMVVILLLFIGVIDRMLAWMVAQILG
jgi:preprotein translocase subunit SecE